MTAEIVVTPTVAAVLKELLEDGRDHYTYGISRRTGMNCPTAFTILTRLHQRGWLTDEWKVGGRSVERRCFLLTPEGREQAIHVLKDYEDGNTTTVGYTDLIRASERQRVAIDLEHWFDAQPMPVSHGMPQPQVHQVRADLVRAIARLIRQPQPTVEVSA